jgi:hypothetical protein
MAKQLLCLKGHLKIEMVMHKTILSSPEQRIYLLHNNNITMSDTNKCPLCNRELAEPIVRHHLIPPSKGGRDTPTVPMHKICQAKVHAVFTETELKNYYNTVDRIKEHEDITKFIKWVSKKEGGFFDTTIKKK